MNNCSYKCSGPCVFQAHRLNSKKPLNSVTNAGPASVAETLVLKCESPAFSSWDINWTNPYAMENTNKWFARSQLCSCQNSNSMTKNSNPENHSRSWKILQYTIFILLLHTMILHLPQNAALLELPSISNLSVANNHKILKMSNTQETVVEWKIPLGAMCSLQQDQTS